VRLCNITFFEDAIRTRMVHIWHILYLHHSAILTRTRKFVPYSCENALEPIHSKIGRQLTIPVIAIIFAPAIAHP
jgi:hypothetical protein